jgi:hypothetical protein
MWYLWVAGGIVIAIVFGVVSFRIGKKSDVKVHEYKKFKVASVTGRNKNGVKRQDVLRSVYEKSRSLRQPKVEIEQYSGRDGIAVSVLVGGVQVGDIEKIDIPTILENWDLIDEVTEISVFGGRAKKSFGAEITVRMRRKQQA